MQSACDGNPNVPLPNYGRLGWFATELERRFNVTVTIETVRKWFAGETIPRTKTMGYLAAVLEVDHASLAVGGAPEMSEKQKKARDATADGAVNVVAGLIQICGGHPAFPVENDTRSNDSKIDLYAVIKGAQYAFNIVMGQIEGDEVVFSVQMEAVHAAFVLGVVRSGELSFRFFELDGERIEAEGKRKLGHYTFKMPLNDRKEILTFSDRL